MKASAKNILTFSAGFGVVAIYNLLWTIFRFHGWKNAFNIPGFVFYVLSWPWSTPFITNNFAHEFGISHNSQLMLSILSIAIGFGVNLLIVRMVICYVAKKFKSGVGT